MKRYALLTMVALGAVIPFSSRAVFMDEHIFLKIARAAQTQWLFPQDTPGMFFGTAIPDFASHTHPPVGEYFLALIYATLGDFHEIPFRLCFAIFPVACLIAFYSLARRFAAEPLWLTLLFASSPAFVVYAPTLMMDVPMLAFLLTGFALYFKYLDGWTGALPLASLCFGLAVGTGYTALVPLGCLVIFMLAARRPRREFLGIAIGLAPVAIWLIAMTVHFGRFPLADTVWYFVNQGSMAWNVAAVLTFSGGVMIFPLSASKRIIYPLTAFIALAVCSLFWPGVARPLWIAILAGSGLAFLALFVNSARKLIISERNAGESFLLLWAPATLIFFIVVGDMINARYLLLAAPALFLIAFREAPRRQLIGILIPTGLLSIAVAYADTAFVNMNREFVEQTVAPLQDRGLTIMGSAESGLRFYLEKRGIRSLNAEDADIDAGALIVRHSGFPFRYSLSPKLEGRLALQNRFDLQNAFPIRTFNAASRAGFHDSRLGLAPFTFTREAYDGIDIAVVCAPAGAAPLEVSCAEKLP